MGERTADGGNGPARALVDNVRRVIRGKDEQVVLAVVALLSGGHLLVEDVPGVGKTMLARSLALSIHGTYRRIQFTPDLLPSDVTGTVIYNQKTSDFEFKPGPIFANVILADEINRATPRTQSSLLEAMDEGQVTADGTTHTLPRPFFVIATQNPVEYHGTYPLPEGQLDRFCMSLTIGYPSAEVEREIVEAQLLEHPVNALGPVLEAGEIPVLQRRVREVTVHPDVLSYAVELVRLTREEEGFHLGSSPRGTIFLVRTAQARAFLEGRDFVTPDDVKALAVPVLAHRVIPAARSRALSEARALIQGVLERVPVPVL
ncbi:MoxR family ATPase [Candidatus Solincola tengchongensis]|uniref:AAA family ATPase n=1 Tax=Candidatus Solincola tengchongensis TaxID=2900693 RepID=UPI00257D533A|nr:MoxR family ATPase [Candidatus Solincola tengchongensis]